MVYFHRKGVGKQHLTRTTFATYSALNLLKQTSFFFSPQQWCSRRVCLCICGDAGVTWNNIATGCANLWRLVFAFALCHACDAHIPEHLNSTGTRVSMEALFWFVSLPHTVSVCFCVFFKSRNLLLTNLLTGLQPWYWMPTYYSSSGTYVLYIITFLNQQSAYLQSVKRSRKMCCQSTQKRLEGKTFWLIKQCAV